MRHNINFIKIHKAAEHVQISKKVGTQLGKHDDSEGSWSREEELPQ